VRLIGACVLWVAGYPSCRNDRKLQRGLPSRPRFDAGRIREWASQNESDADRSRSFCESRRFRRGAAFALTFAALLYLASNRTVTARSFRRGAIMALCPH
jgi:hypothetical protein